MPEAGQGRANPYNSAPGRAGTARRSQLPIPRLLHPSIPIFLAALLALAACDRPGAGPAAPTLALADCRITGLESQAQCGKLQVWEDREAKSGRRIPIKVAVVPARSRARAADPLFIFAGGPGQGAVSLMAQLVPLFARLNTSRDLVFIDQRGTGESHPLNCDGDGGLSVESMLEDRIPEELVVQCLKKLDADPRQYVTTVAMRDIDDVRRALGYDTINLWGGSYGTRAALEYLRLYPEHVRSAVLDGVAPATMLLPLSFTFDGDAAFEAMLVACEADTGCHKAFPRLREDIAYLRVSLRARPMKAAVADPLTGAEDAIPVTEAGFLASLFRPLYVPELASLLPLGISSAREGNFNPLFAQNFEMAEDIGDDLAVGLHLSVVCSEDVPRITPEALAGAGKGFFGRALVDDFINACRHWPKGKVDPEYYEPVRSDVPVLLLSGGIDPATPPRHAEHAARTLPNARHLVAPNLGHGVSAHGCAPRLIEKFVKAGSAADLDATCLARIPRPLFALPLGERPAAGKTGKAGRK
jgi:pimeloyl-ACP methyl ester carboxylesterase